MYEMKRRFAVVEQASRFAGLCCLRAILKGIQIAKLFVRPPGFDDIRTGKSAIVTFVGRCHPVLTEDPHHQKCRIEVQGPFFGSTDGNRSDACRFAFLDRIEQILPEFDPVWINPRFVTYLCLCDLSSLLPEPTKPGYDYRFSRIGATSLRWLQFTIFGPNLCSAASFGSTQRPSSSTRHAGRVIISSNPLAIYTIDRFREFAEKESHGSREQSSDLQFC